jgi:hypothetical protein
MMRGKFGNEMKAQPLTLIFGDNNFFFHTKRRFLQVDKVKFPFPPSSTKAALNSQRSPLSLSFALSNNKVSSQFLALYHSERAKSAAPSPL